MQFPITLFMCIYIWKAILQNQLDPAANIHTNTVYEANTEVCELQTSLKVFGITTFNLQE